jgi:hypothetical protein
MGFQQSSGAGRTFAGVIERDVPDTGGRVAIHRGANATLVVRSASGQGKLQGQSDLAVDVSSVEVVVEPIGSKPAALW